MKWRILAVAMVVSLMACKKEEEVQETPVIEGSKIYVGNEGNFGASNADVSYIDENGTIHNEVFYAVNGVPLGDVLQSLTIDGNKAFAVMNNSNTIVVFNPDTYAPIQVIDDVEYPRYVHHYSTSKAYVTAGSGAGSVYALDKSTYALSSAIAVGTGPEGMTSSNDQLYVCNSGGWGVDQTVSVIDTDTDVVTATITVSDVPVDAVTDANGDVWVLCKGQTLYDDSWNVIGHTDARLYHIDEMTNTVIDFISVGSNGDHPASLAISSNKQTLYVANGDLYSMPITGSDMQVFVSGSFYTVDVSQRTGDIWATGISDFVNPTMVYHFTTSGTLVADYTAGIGANCVVEP
jgi:YVTN family beta-propeller protein